MQLSPSEMCCVAKTIKINFSIFYTAPLCFMENKVHFVPLIRPRKVQYILLKALPQVCMENTARGACREINTARGEAECCIYLETCPRVLYFSYK